MERPVSRILLSTDNSGFSAGAEREAIRLAQTCSTALYVLSVVQVNPELDAMAPGVLEKAEEETRVHLEDLRRKAGEKGVQCAVIARHGEDPSAAVLEEAGKLGADLIVMGRRGQTGLKRLVMGSNTARVTGKAPCNVLIVPREAEVRYKCILSAVDNSAFSARAARFALSLARFCGSKIVFVSAVYSPVDGAEYQQALVMEMEERDLETAGHLVWGLTGEARASGLESEGVVLTGMPHEAILQTAEEKGADLVVMGSHGRSGLKKLLMGSVTEKVVTRSKSAVLVVKA